VVEAGVEELGAPASATEGLVDAEETDPAGAVVVGEGQDDALWVVRF
jgi:hypothetical protein